MATLTLLWLEGAEPGTAAGNHLAGTIQRLATLGITDVRVLASRAGSRKRTTVARLRRLGGLMVRGSVVPKQSRQLLARWHPLLTFPMLMWKLRGRSVYLCVQGVLDDCVAENPMVRRVPMLDRLARWSLAHADGVVVPDPGIGVWAAKFAGLDPASITTLRNGVDLARFDRDPAAGSDGADLDDADYAIFVGNLATWQGVDSLLGAVRSAAWPDGLSLKIVGDGAMAAEVEAAQSDRVAWLGWQPPETVARLLGRASLAFALRTDGPESSNGTSPFKLLEAAAARVPTVVSRVPGQADVALELGGSVLVEPGNAEDVATAVRDLYQQPEVRQQLADTAARNVQRFAWDHEAPTLGRVLGLVPGSGRATPTSAGIPA